MPRSNSLKLASRWRTNLPMFVVVSKLCVVETNRTPWVSNFRMIARKSARLRLRRSIL